MIFPPYNAYEWLSLQKYATMGESLLVSKITSHNLRGLAPDIARFLQNTMLDLDALNTMLRAFKSQVSVRELACDWLKNNEDRWRAWIPVATECGNGFGLYSKDKGFVATREEASTCAACLPGTYSMHVNLQDSLGPTRMCKSCQAGQQQPAAASMECEACPAGTFKSLESDKNCQACAQGWFQDEAGARNCKKCPENTTTLVRGATNSTDCVCMAGTIDAGDVSKGFSDCVTCMKGLDCPAGSTLASLRGGAMEGPAILPGRVARNAWCAYMICVHHLEGWLC